MTRRARGHTAFTLIELLVVIGIITFLVVRLLPAVNACREAARRAQCVNNLAQIGIALQTYQTIHEVLPSGVVNDTGPIKNIPKGYHFGWMTQILPLVDRQSVYRRLDFSVSVYDQANLTARQTLIATFLCPTDRGPARETDDVASSSYAACYHDAEAPIGTKNRGVFFLNSNLRYEDIPDGSSNTIFVGEKRRLGIELGWASGTKATLRNGSEFGSVGTSGTANGFSRSTGHEAPPDEPENPDPVGGFGRLHPGGASFTFGDGSVRFLKNTISASVFRLLTNRADGELLSADQY